MSSTCSSAPTRRLSLAAGAILGLFGFAFPSAAQNLLTNGDFGTVAAGTSWSDNGWANYFDFSAYPTALAGWTYAVGGGAPDAVSNYYIPGSPFSGYGYLVQLGAGSDLTGGSISQGFSSTTGAIYTASLDVAYVGNGGGSAITFGIYDVNNGSALVGSQTTAFSSLTNSFQTVSFDFVAPSTNLTFRISDASGGTVDTDVAAGNASIALKTIPEPSTYAAIAGVLALGFAFWRRQRR
jgi:hypothetical protein